MTDPILDIMLFLLVLSPVFAITSSLLATNLEERKIHKSIEEAEHQAYMRMARSIEQESIRKEIESGRLKWIDVKKPADIRDRK